MLQASYQGAEPELNQREQPEQPRVQGTPQEKCHGLSKNVSIKKARKLEGTILDSRIERRAMQDLDGGGVELEGGYKEHSGSNRGSLNMDGILNTIMSI